MSVTIGGSTINWNSGAVTPASVGTAPYYPSVRAWVNYTTVSGGVGGAIAINGSGGISSVTLRTNGGFYSLNFSSAMPDINYSVVQTGAVSQGFGGSQAWYSFEQLVFGGPGNAYPVRNRTTSSVQVVNVTGGGSAAYGASINFVIYR
jgi:hypothetical protein